MSYKQIETRSFAQSSVLHTGIMGTTPRSLLEEHIVRKAFLRRRDIDRPAQALTQHHDLGRGHGKRRGQGEEEASPAVSGTLRVADVGPKELARLRERVPVAAAARARRQRGGRLALVGPGPLRHRERHAARAVLVREHVEELLGLALTHPTIAAIRRRAPLADERMVCCEAGKDSGIFNRYLAINPWSHVSAVLTHAQYLPSVPFSSRQCRYLPGSAQAPQSAAYSPQTSTWEQSFPSTSSHRRRPLWKHCSSASRSARLGGLSGVVTALTRPSSSQSLNIGTPPWSACAYREK
jgi:hypothetical protein